MSVDKVPFVFRHEFEPGVGYEGTVLKDTTPSRLDKLLKRSAHYERVELIVKDFNNNQEFGTGETRWIRKGRLDKIRMAHSLRREELKAWELCKECLDKEIPFSSAIEDGLIKEYSG